jgi:hypothetical protein
MVAAGAHPKLLQAQLGHTSINVKLNTYGHLSPDAFADVGDALDSIVRAADARARCEGSRGSPASRRGRMEIVATREVTGS